MQGGETVCSEYLATGPLSLEAVRVFSTVSSGPSFRNKSQFSSKPKRIRAVTTLINYRIPDWSDRVSSILNDYNISKNLTGMPVHGRKTIKSICVPGL